MCRCTFLHAIGKFSEYQLSYMYTCSLLFPKKRNAWKQPSYIKRHLHFMLTTRMLTNNVSVLLCCVYLCICERPMYRLIWHRLWLMRPDGDDLRGLICLALEEVGLQSCLFTCIWANSLCKFHATQPSLYCGLRVSCYGRLAGQKDVNIPLL